MPIKDSPGAWIDPTLIAQKLSIVLELQIALMAKAQISRHPSVEEVPTGARSTGQIGRQVGDM
jgi:hypothetical protein